MRNAGDGVMITANGRTVEVFTMDGTILATKVPKNHYSTHTLTLVYTQRININGMMFSYNPLILMG